MIDRKVKASIGEDARVNQATTTADAAPERPRARLRPLGRDRRRRARSRSAGSRASAQASTSASTRRTPRPGSAPAPRSRPSATCACSRTREDKITSCRGLGRRRADGRHRRRGRRVRHQRHHEGVRRCVEDGERHGAHDDRQRRRHACRSPPSRRARSTSSATNVAVGGAAGIGGALVVPIVTKTTYAYDRRRRDASTRRARAPLDVRDGTFAISFVDYFTTTTSPRRDFSDTDVGYDSSQEGATDPRVDQQLTHRRDATPGIRSGFRGVAVTAINSDDVGAYGIGVSASGTASVQLSAAIHVMTADTHAWVGNGANVNQGDDRRGRRAVGARRRRQRLRAHRRRRRGRGLRRRRDHAGPRDRRHPQHGARRTSTRTRRSTR